MHSDDPQIAAEIREWFTSRRVAQHYLYIDEHRPIGVDTSKLTAYLWETAVQWQDGSVEIVAQYGQRETAVEGHVIVIRAIVDKLRETDKTVIAILPEIGSALINTQEAEELAERIATLMDDTQHERGKGNDET